MKLDSLAHKTLKFLASLKLAVLILLSLGVISAWGTIVESRFNAEIAQKLVYKSPYMYGTMILLTVNLIAVMIDRLPWQKRHHPFLMAHVGIILVLLGSFITQKRGVDGSIVFEIGESNSFVTISNTDLNLYIMEDFKDYKKIFTQEVDFYLNPPSKKNFSIPTNEGEVKITNYMPFANQKTNVVATDRSNDGPGIRFQLKNQFTSQVDWMVQQGANPSVRDFGPVQLILAKEKYVPDTKGNKIIVWPMDEENLAYALFDKDSSAPIEGKIKKGQPIKTEWMGLEVLILNYYKNAQYQFEYEPMPKPTELTTSALEVQFQGKTRWVGLNSALQLYTDKTMYVLTFSNRRIPLGFNMKLLDFQVGKYQGTNKAMTYQSHVEIPNHGDFYISMNEPLKHKGYTFYQASFQQDETGKPIASILSVNQDPGRWLKYLGSLLIVLGSIYLFYNRKLQTAKKAAT